MRKVVKAVLVMAVIVGIYLTIKRVYPFSEKAIIKTIKSPKEDISVKLPQGSDIDTPLSIPEGFRMGLFADLEDFGSPRVLALDSEGTLFASLPGNGKIIAFPDKDEDGISDEAVEVVSNLNRPHGIEFAEGKIYIAETNRVVRYDYNPATLSVNNREILFTLPSGGRHFTRTIKILEDKLYTSVGSSCDVCDEKDEKRSSILVSNLDGSDLNVFAQGLRNTVFFVFDKNGKIWGNDMGRDFLGDNLPPDELNIVEEGKNYGWPYCYGKRVRDSKYKSNEEEKYCENTEETTFDYPAHISPLGLAFIDSNMFPNSEQGNLLSSFHGSWNSSIPVGYKIVKLEIEGEKVLRMEDFITGWLREDGEVLGRPADLVFGDNGALYISDDKANLIYILTKEK